MDMYDLIVVGGGIIGAGVARDAALRGLNVALFEKSDFGAGTTAGSTRLIHGGLRYLEMLDFRLVRMDLRERETLLRIAPHLVKPLEFVVPFYDRNLFYRAKMRAGMLLYDAFSYDRSLPGHRFLSAAEVRTREPQLRAEGLQGAASYYDAQVNSPERLCLENILDARAHGAQVRNYCEVTGALRDQGGIRGVRVRDSLTGEETEVHGRLVVNASGPWFDRAAQALEQSPRRVIRSTKGIHIACESHSRDAVVLFAPDNRLFFVIPWLGYSWIGTTDTDFTGDPADARATGDDVAYLLRSTQPFFPALRESSILWSNAGVRALVMQPGSESSVSRLHKIIDGSATGSPGLVSIAGGKITGYRAIAEEAVDLVCRRLGQRYECVTATMPLPGAAASLLPTALEPGVMTHLRSLYGSRAAEVAEAAAEQPNLAQPLAPAYPDIAAQVVHAVRHELCLRLPDFLLRRTFIGFSRDQGLEAVPAAAALMARELAWTPARTKAEVDAYRVWVESTRAFQHPVQLN